MRSLVVGVILEVLVGVSLAGMLLAIVIPLLNRYDLIAAGDRTATAIIVAVLAGALAVALFRPGSSIHRYIRR